MSAQEYRVTNLDCPNCARELQDGIRRLDGVDFAEVDFNNGKLILKGSVSEKALYDRAQALGHQLGDMNDKNDAQPGRGGVLGFWDYLVSRQNTRLALGGAALILVGVLLSVAGVSSPVPEIIYTLALTLALYPIASSGINALRINRQITIDMLMSIAGAGALLVGEYLEGAAVIFLFVIGEAIEGYVTQQARNSIKSLLELRPNEATRITDSGEEVVPVEALGIGDAILVRPGERVPMDGVVQSGSSSVNQAPITGESIPVSKTEGAEVYAGSINENGTLTVEVTKHAADNTLSRIIQMVEDAQGRRAPSQRMIDRFAQYYTPAVVVAALLVATVPPLFFGEPFFGTADQHGWFYRALIMLVISCPCALVISTPVTVISAISKAARQGVLIKGGAHLEALGTVNTIAFDKTGTLTEGRPVVTKVRSVECSDDPGCTSCDDLLALAAAVESRSTHPLAQAVIDEAQSRDVLSRYDHADDVESLTGRGVQGHVNGQQVVVGSHALFDDTYSHPDWLCREVQQAEQQGNTTMLLHDGNQVRGFIAVADKVRANSPQVVRDLNALGMQTVMLTGDNPTVAQAVGQRVGVRDVRASLLPDDKVKAVETLMQSRHVVMVGDGVNDTPALAAATVGVAMGGAGSAQSMETADVTLMADDLSRLPFAMRLARFSRRIILQNVGLAIAMKLIFLVLAAGGAATMWMAIFADVGMLLVVTLNGVRPLRFQWESASSATPAETMQPQRV